MAAPKIERTIARLQERIRDGQYYEAHQQLRVVAARYVKQKNWRAAVDTLFSGAQALLQAGQHGSGTDLGRFLVGVLGQAGEKADADNKGKLISLLRMFPPEEPSWKRFGDEAIAWSATAGEYPAGDPELHEVVGELFAQEPEPYEAERHLVLGTDASPAHLADLEFDWYGEDDAHTAPLYAARAVLPYLLVGNVRGAANALRLFTDRLIGANAHLGVQDATVAGVRVRIFPSMPLLNFLSLLLLAVQRGKADLFRLLCRHYATHLKEANGWGEALERVGEIYFGIPIRRQMNPLFDMMGRMFSGGGAGAGAGGGAGGGGGAATAPMSALQGPRPAEVD